jgi:hypothetical protein
MFWYISNKYWDMATIKSFFIRCVILFILIIDDEYNYNLKPLIDVGVYVSHLKEGLCLEDFCQRTLILKF